MMLTDLATVLRAAGLTVIELDGWKKRGHGEMTDVKGVTCHHTASGRGTGVSLGLNTIRDGRTGLAGPLAHLYLNRTGVFYTVAAGLCWHAGVSHQSDQTNSHRIGIEALAAGDGWAQDWPPAQMAAYARGCKALSEHYKFQVSEVLGHKETAAPAGRKVDPSFSMGGFRSTVSSINLKGPTPVAADQSARIITLIGQLSTTVGKVVVSANSAVAGVTTLTTVVAKLITTVAVNQTKTEIALGELNSKITALAAVQPPKE